MTATPPTPAASDDSGTVSSHTANGVATIRFGHPKGNSLPATILRDLADAVRRAGDDPAARVIVLRSEGTGAFCAGASFAELRAVSTEEEGREFFMGFARLILAMRSAPKLILARVHGRAVGGGVGVAAAADYALAVESASVKLSELAVGIGPFVVGPAIEKKIGLGGFAALAVDATAWRDAAWAERHGLYARLYPATDELDAGVDELATRLAASNPAAMSAMKRAFWAGTEGWDALLAERAGMSGRLVLSEHARKAIASFG